MGFDDETRGRTDTNFLFLLCDTPHDENAYMCNRQNSIQKLGFFSVAICTLIKYDVQRHSWAT